MNQEKDLYLLLTNHLDPSRQSIRAWEQSVQTDAGLPHPSQIGDIGQMSLADRLGLVESIGFRPYATAAPDTIGVTVSAYFVPSPQSVRRRYFFGCRIFHPDITDHLPHLSDADKMECAKITRIFTAAKDIVLDVLIPQANRSIEMMASRGAYRGNTFLEIPPELHQFFL